MTKIAKTHARRDDEHAGEGEGGVAAGRHGVAAAAQLRGAGHAEHAHRRREAQPDRRGEGHARELQQVLDGDGGDHASAVGIGWRSCERRPKAATMSATTDSATTTGPSAPVPKIRVAP